MSIEFEDVSPNVKLTMKVEPKPAGNRGYTCTINQTHIPPGAQTPQLNPSGLSNGPVSISLTNSGSWVFKVKTGFISGAGSSHGAILTVSVTGQLDQTAKIFVDESPGGQLDIHTISVSIV